VLNQAPGHEYVLGGRVIALRILYVGTRRRWGVSFTPRPLYPRRKSPRYRLNRRLGGPQCRSRRGGEEKKFPALAGNRTPSSPSPSPQPATTPTEMNHREMEWEVAVTVQW